MKFKDYVTLIALVEQFSFCEGFHARTICQRRLIDDSSVHAFSLFAEKNEKDRQLDEKISQQPTTSYRSGSLMAATAEIGRVPYGESSRKYRRTVYSHEDWIKHRSEDRLAQNLSGIFYSGIVRQLQNECLLIMSISAAVLLWNQVVLNGDVLSNMDLSLPQLSLPALPFTLSSPALGLLLVFRTNASYSRWMEARTQWGRTISQSRNIIRMAATFTENKQDESLNRLGVTVWVLVRSIMNHLSSSDDELDYQKEIHKVLGSNDPLAKRMIESQDRALSALMEVSLALDKVPIDEKRRVEIDKSSVIIGDCLAACERIYQQPVPLVYTRHTARFLSLWMLLLPLGLYETLRGWILIPTLGVLALFLFGIEELSVQLEEPFSILPMQHYCDGIREQTKQMIEWSAQSASDSKGIGE